MIAGFLWIVYLVKDSADSGDNGTNLAGATFISLGACLPFASFALTKAIYESESLFFHLGISVVCYLFVGLVSNIIYRDENGGGGFLPEPFILEGKVFI